MAEQTVVVRNQHEGELRWFAGGGVHRWLATSEETAGSFLVFEDSMEGGKATPLHSHPTAESLYVLKGSIVLHIDGVDHQLGRGSFATAPQGVPHAFMVTSGSARLLFLHTPGPAECQAFYWDASQPLGQTRDVDFAQVRAAAERTGGMTLLGPPPFPQSS
jgi:quercetin dioxygenase-like cupin family protein